MITSREIIEAAIAHISEQELRGIIDGELRGTTYDTFDLRLILAADLICDAALEVVAQLSKGPVIKKFVTFGWNTQMQFSEMSIVGALKRLYEDELVSMEELQALLLRSATSDAISKALRAGESTTDFAEGKIIITPIRLTQLLMKQTKPKGLLQRLFGRA